MACAEMDAVKRILPPRLEEIMYCAAAWAQRKEPLRFTSMTLENCEAGASMDGTQPTMPAKQTRTSIEVRSEWAVEKAEVTEEGDVTSMGTVWMGVFGKEA